MTKRSNNIPRHIAIIMDGNGRWARNRGLERSAGHKAGVDTVRRITTECARMGVEYLTLYTFSTENWNRPSEEVSALMGLVLTSLEDEIFMKNNVRFRVIGDVQRLPVQVSEKLHHTEQRTAANTAMTLVVALSYSSRWEITQAVRSIVKEHVHAAEEGKESKQPCIGPGMLSLDDITEDYLGRHLQTDFMPDPDLLIRTGGELRISNYLLWQLAYTELYFTDTYWPDFAASDLHQAIESYAQRQRRYGKTGEQITDNDDKTNTQDERKI